MIENIALSFQGIWSHKLRSFLTMLGIIIGIASIITIVSTIKGTNEQIKQNLIGSGNNVVDVKLTQDGNQLDFSWNPIPQDVKVIQEETRTELDQLDGVEETSVYLSRNWAENVFFRNTGFNGSVYGIDSHYLSVYGYRVIYGRGFSEADFTEAHKNLLINDKTADNLFAGVNPVGKTIEIKGEPFTVIGVITAANNTFFIMERLL